MFVSAMVLSLYVGDAFTSYLTLFSVAPKRVHQPTGARTSGWICVFGSYVCGVAVPLEAVRTQGRRGGWFSRNDITLRGRSDRDGGAALCSDVWLEEELTPLLVRGADWEPQ